jgi:hypothetical protein
MIEIPAPALVPRRLPTGVPLRTAQDAMRHSDPSLTANVYTDPKLLDVAGAVASLPDLPLGMSDRTVERVATHSTPTAQ